MSSTKYPTLNLQFVLQFIPFITYKNFKTPQQHIPKIVLSLLLKYQHILHTSAHPTKTQSKNHSTIQTAKIFTPKSLSPKFNHLSSSVPYSKSGRKFKSDFLTRSLFELIETLKGHFI